MVASTRRWSTCERGSGLCITFPFGCGNSPPACLAAPGLRRNFAIRRLCSSSSLHCARGCLGYSNFSWGPSSLMVTGLRPLACIGRTHHGLGLSLAVVRAALQGRFGSAQCAARRVARLHMRFAGDAWVVERHVAPFWDQAPVPVRRASDWMPQL